MDYSTFYIKWIYISIYTCKDTNPCHKRYTYMNIYRTSPIDYSTIYIKCVYIYLYIDVKIQTPAKRDIHI